MLTLLMTSNVDEHTAYKTTPAITWNGFKRFQLYWNSSDRLVVNCSGFVCLRIMKLSPSSSSQILKSDSGITQNLWNPVFDDGDSSHSRLTQPVRDGSATRARRGRRLLDLEDRLELLIDLARRRISSDFRGLVLGCLEAKFCKKICV